MQQILQVTNLKKMIFFLLAVYLSIFILVINQLDAKKKLFYNKFISSI